MKSFRYFLPFMIAAVFTLIGCRGKIHPESGLFGGGRVTEAAANQLIDEEFENFSVETLLFLLDPEGKRLHIKMHFPKISKTKNQ